MSCRIYLPFLGRNLDSHEWTPPSVVILASLDQFDSLLYRAQIVLSMEIHRSMFVVTKTFSSVFFRPPLIRFGCLVVCVFFIFG